MIEEKLFCEACGRRFYLENPARRKLFFSEREHEIVRLVYQGLANKEIGSRINISEKTVKFHLTKIFRKANVVSRGQLIRACADDKSLLEPNRPIEAKLV